MRRLGLLAMLSVLFVSVLAAQLKVDVGLVNIVATVTDRQGRYVDDLLPEDFILKEDGQVQTITHLSQSTDLPVSVGIVLDTSGSMERKIKTATNAVERFIRMIHKDDDIFLMTFDQRPDLRQDFTDNRDKLANALRRVTLGNGTSLYDALDQSLDKMKRAKYEKRAILLISDGEDTSSFATFERTAAHVRESELLVYCLAVAPTGGPLSDGVIVPGSPRGGSRTPPVIISPPGGGRGGGSTFPFPFPIPIPGRRLSLQRTSQQPRGTLGDVNMDVMDTFATSSGGKAWLLGGSWTGDRNSEIDRALDEIAAELRNQYSIGYYPEHGVKDGKWHRIEIKPKDSRYTVRFKADYFGG